MIIELVKTKTKLTKSIIEQIELVDFKDFTPETCKKYPTRYTILGYININGLKTVLVYRDNGKYFKYIYRDWKVVEKCEKFVLHSEDNTREFVVKFDTYDDAYNYMRFLRLNFLGAEQIFI